MTQRDQDPKPMTEPAENPLLDFLLAVLTSIMAPALGDSALARRAAMQAIEAYQPRDTYELIATGQILSFAMSALETLRQAASPDLSPSMQLKLRGNANGLNRAARDNTRNLETSRQAATAGWQDPAPPDQNTPPANEHPNRQGWAGAMNRVAAKLRTNPPAATPVHRTVNALWIDTLTGVAQELTQPELTQPAAPKPAPT